MDDNTQNFHDEMNNAVLPALRWTQQDKRSFWNIPVSQWGDYFSLLKAKRRMMQMYAKKQVIRKMPKLVPLYMAAVRKKRVMTLDYLQEYGGSVLSRFVQNHFRRKYGLNSKQWKAFLIQEEEGWKAVLALRLKRKENFIRQKIMSLKKISRENRKKLLEEETESLRRRLESYYYYKDGKDRRGKKMPEGQLPPKTSLVLLERDR